MNEFDTLAERYRRYRAVHKYDRWLRFWILDSVLFLIKLAVIVIAFLTLVHFTPQVPAYFKSLVAQSQGEPPEQRITATNAAPDSAIQGLEGAATHSVELEQKTVIPASLEPENIQPSLPAWQLVTIAVSRANLREQPTTQSPVLGQLARGNTLTLFDVSGKWAQVATNDERGISGYVHVSLLEEREDQLLRKSVSP